jgi:C2H2 type zinc finger protein
MASHPDDYMFDFEPTLPQHANSHLPQWEQDPFRANTVYPTRQVQETHHTHWPPYPRPYGSPQSQSQSTCSDVRSPVMETDPYSAHSPQDAGLSMQYEYDNHHIHFAGHGDHHALALPAPGTVSMSLVNPDLESLSPELHQGEPFDLDPNFELIEAQRTESLSTMAPGQELRVPASQPTRVDNRLSPEDMNVLPEISVANPSYPELFHGESHSDAMDDDANSIPEDDPDYQPPSKIKASGSRRSSTTSKHKQKNTPRSSAGRVAKHKRGVSVKCQPMTPTTPIQGGFTCSSCQHEFKDEDSLQKHMKSTHARPFTCVFGFAGCTSTFASKNEWKRHVLSQHVLLHYWICTEPACAEAYKETHGAIFNRKDLYTQHVRRMHVPTQFRKPLKTRKTVPEWDDQLRRMQEKALVNRCQLPTFLQCPASACNMEFNGTNAWDDRMEHVARHLEKAALGEEHEVRFGGKSDPTLNDWAASPHVRIIRPAVGEDRWELAQPLKTTSQGNSTVKNTREQHSDSEDGHFEVDD